MTVAMAFLLTPQQVLTLTSDTLGYTWSFEAIPITVLHSD